MPDMKYSSYAQAYYSVLCKYYVNLTGLFSSNVKSKGKSLLV